MPKNYLPREGAALLEWARNFRTYLNATPGSAYGLTQPQVDEYDDAFAAYEAAYLASQEMATKGPVATFTKTVKKVALEKLARKLVTIIQGQPTTTDEDRFELRITIRDDVPGPVPVPTQAPMLELRSVRGRLINLRAKREDGGRGKPVGASAVWMYLYVGEAAPTSMGEYDFAGSSSNTRPQVIVPAEVPVGAKVWVTAAWINARQQVGPAAQPVYTWTNHAVLSQAG